MSPPFRYQVAELWHQCSKLKRSDIFGTPDLLCPKYSKPSKLEDQIDVVAVGMVGIDYRPGGLAILSVNPAGGKSTSRTDSNSDKMYERFRDLQKSGSKDQKLDNFEDANDAVIRSIGNWSVTKEHLNPILSAVRKKFEEIAYLYVVPFRTEEDEGSKMKKEYIERGYQNHLKKQLDILMPKTIIAIDKPSKEMAKCFKRDRCSKIKVIYYTRNRSAHDERKKVLECLRNNPI